MSKEVSLSHAERLELQKVLNTAQFKELAKMADALTDAKLIAHSPEEIKEVNLRTNPEGTSLLWDEDSKEKTVTLSDTTVDAFRDYLKKREEAGDLTITDQNLITLKTKLN